MSMQLSAQRLAAHGRGGDSTLVHMSPQEVAGLQALAKAHGTSLTVNPHTGLPEALSLKSILPAVAGFALGPAGFGLMSSLGAAATVGGLAALTSGSLSKGLMAGMSAYGGSALGEGLGSLGANASAEGAYAGASGLTDAEAAARGFSSAEEAAQAAAATARKEFASKALTDRLGAGVSAAVDNPSGLVSSLGGGSKALQTGYMLAAPIMADQAVQTTTKAPAMDTGYIRPYYNFNPKTLSWQTAAPIKASTIGFADGGTPYAPRSSQEAFDYLMGKTPARKPATTPVIVQGFGGPSEVAGTGGKYVRDPVTGTYKFVPDTGVQTTSGPSSFNYNTYNTYGSGASSPSDTAPSSSPDAPGPTGAASTSSPGVAGTIGNAIGNAIGMGLNSLGLNTQDPNVVSVTDATNAANSSASQDSASPASDTAATATAGPGGTGGNAAAAAAAAASAATSAGMSDAAAAVASQSAANAAVSGMSVSDAVAAGISAANDAVASGAVSTGDTGAGDTSSGATGTSGVGAGDSGGVSSGDSGGASTGSSGDSGGAGAGASGGDGGGPGGGGDGGPGGGGDGGSGSGDKRGGLIGLAMGGMKNNAFVVPADVISSLGNGSTKAGLAALNQQLSKLAGGGATLIQGPGNGLSDSIPTNIEGRRPARVADGEAYIDPRVVKRLGGGNVDNGAAKLYKMMDRVRKQAHGKTAQQRPVNPNKVLA